MSATELIKCFNFLYLILVIRPLSLSLSVYVCIFKNTYLIDHLRQGNSLVDCIIVLAVFQRHFYRQTL